MSQLFSSTQRSLLGRASIQDWRPDPQDEQLLFMTLPSGSAGIRLGVTDTVIATINECQQMLTGKVTGATERFSPGHMLLATISRVESADLSAGVLHFELYPILRVGYPHLTIAQAVGHPDPDSIPLVRGSLTAMYSYTIAPSGLSLGVTPTYLRQSQSETSMELREIDPEHQDEIGGLMTYTALKLVGDCGRLLRHWIPSAVLAVNREALVGFLRQELPSLFPSFNREQRHDLADVLRGLADLYSSAAVLGTRHQGIRLKQFAAEISELASNAK